MSGRDFITFDGRGFHHDTFDFYGELAGELGLEDRALAKTLYWSVVYRAGDLRLGTLSQGVDMADISAEDSHAYSLTGDFVRHIIEHYIIEMYRMENVGRQEKVA